MLKNERIDYLLEMMSNHGIDVFVIAPSADLNFLIELSVGTCERFQAFFLLSNGDYFYISPQLYYEEVSEILDDNKIIMWKDSEGFLKAVKDLVYKYNLENKRIAINNTINAVDLIDFSSVCNCDFSNGHFLLEKLRLIKTGEEIEFLKEAARLADEIMDETVKYLKPGIREYEIKERIKRSVRELGADGVSFEPIVASGPNSSKPHYNKGQRTIQKKDIIILDLGCKYKGYCSDISRTIFIGGISSKEKEVYSIVKGANSAAEKIVKPGITAEEVDQKARDIIEDKGFGDYFLNRTGHGIGISVHEAPFIKTGNKIELQKGMAFSIEPGIYLPGEFGIRIEDIVVVTDKGREVLNSYAKEIIVK